MCSTPIDPLLVMYRPAPLDDVLGRGNATRLFTLRLLLAFAGVAIALAILGLYGVLAYAVRLRAREFGIRMALGASPSAIRSMVLRQGIVVTSAGLAAGCVRRGGAVARDDVAALPREADGAGGPRGDGAGDGRRGTARGLRASTAGDRQRIRATCCRSVFRRT